MHLWCRGLHWPKRKASVSQRCPSCRWGYNEGCNKSFLMTETQTTFQHMWKRNCAFLLSPTKWTIILSVTKCCLTQRRKKKIRGARRGRKKERERETERKRMEGKNKIMREWEKRTGKRLREINRKERERGGRGGRESERKRNMHAPWTRKRRPKRFVTPLVPILSYSDMDYIINILYFFFIYIYLSNICISYTLFSNNIVPLRSFN